MKNKVVFEERQRFMQWWLWILLLGINGIFLYGVFEQVIGGKQFGDNPMSNVGLLIVFGLTLLLTLFFAILRLDTIVDRDGIYVRFYPFHLRFKQYRWDTLTQSFIRKYSPIGEYGGWGVRIGSHKKGRAYNVSGNMGLQLEFTDHKKLLIGTLKPEELTETLRLLGQLK